MSTAWARLQSGIVKYPWTSLIGLVLAAWGIGLFVANSLLTGAILTGGAAIAVAIPRTRPAARNAAIAVAAIVLCLAAAEIVIQASKGSHTEHVGVVHRHEPPPLYVPIPMLGWQPRASATIRALSMYGDKTIYDAVYTIDAEQRRVVPASNPDGELVIFFGDSFIFGDGVNDAETLPNRVALASGGRYRVLNFGVSGYGAGQTLTRLESGAVDKAVAGGKVRQVFLWFNDDHLLRDGGDYAHAHWGDVAQYEITPEGVRNMGMSRDVRAKRGWIVRRVMSAVLGSEIAVIVRRGFRTSRQLALAEAILTRIRLQVRERYGAELVVIYWSKDRLYYPDRIPPMIARTGATMLFLQPLFAQAGLTLEDFLIPDDGHGTARFHHFVADHLVRRFLPPAEANGAN